MSILDIFGNRRERRREAHLQKGMCPECSGRGYFSSGFEAVYVQDCDACLGTGRAIRKN